MGTYRISQLAEQTGLPATTLRYYEKEGLLPAARTPAGYRTYTGVDVDRVQFISAAKHLGLTLQQIRDLLSVWTGGRCREVRDELRPMVETQITAAELRIHDLRSFCDRLESAMGHLRDLPAKDGPCDPDCAFLHTHSSRVPATALSRQSVFLPVPRAVEESDCAVVACSLDSRSHVERRARWRQLLGDAPRTRSLEGGVTVHLPSTQAGSVAELVVAEQECCPFFTFHMTFAGSEIALTAHAPAAARPLVDALFGMDDPV